MYRVMISVLFLLPLSKFAMDTLKRKAIPVSSISLDAQGLVSNN